METINVENRKEKEIKIIIPGEVKIYNYPTNPDAPRPKNAPRTIISKAKDCKITSIGKKDRVIIYTCINFKGIIEKAEFIKTESGDKLSQDDIDFIINCVKKYRYNEAPNAPTKCGNLVLPIGIH